VRNLFCLPQDVSLQAAQELFRTQEYAKVERRNIVLTHAEPDLYLAEVLDQRKAPIQELPSRLSRGEVLILWDVTPLSPLAQEKGALAKTLAAFKDSGVKVRVLNPAMDLDVDSPEVEGFLSLLELASSGRKGAASNGTSRFTRKEPPSEVIQAMRAAKRRGATIKDIAGRFGVSMHVAYTRTKDIKGVPGHVRYREQRAKEQEAREGGERFPPQAFIRGRVALREQVEPFLRTKASEKTREVYARELVKWFAFLEDRQIPSHDPLNYTEELVALFLDDERKRGCGNASRNKTLTIVSSYCKYLMRKRVIQENPTMGIERPRLRRHEVQCDILSPSEIEAILEEARDEIHKALKEGNELKVFRAKQTLVIIHVLASVGLRRDSLHRLRLRDVLTGRTPKIRCIVKGGYQEVLAIPKETSDILASFIREFSRERPPETYIFRPTPRATSMVHPDSVRVSMQRLAKKAGVDARVTHHVFRASYAVICHQNGMPASMVRDRLLHRDLQTTGKYLKKATNEHDSAREYLPEALVSEKSRDDARLVGSKKEEEA
jgi:site-specific recombinase XerD